MMPALLPRVYLVTDLSAGADVPARVAAALAGLPPRSVAVQLRAKELGGRDLLRLARLLCAATSAAGQALLVNDRLDVALLAGADGVHLPSTGLSPADARRLLGPEALVGVSCHAAADVARARDGGADFGTFGPIYDTPSKRAYGAPLGLDRLREASTLGLPLLGLGGVNETNAAAVVAAGAFGVAAIRAWLEGPDPAAAVRRLLSISIRGTEGLPGGSNGSR